MPRQGPSSPEASPAGKRAPDRELLDRVLDWTETALSSEDALDTADVEAIHAVARRHPGAPLALEPIVVELVKAILIPYFTTNPHWLPVCDDACSVVAQSLFEDPASRGRLEVLWSRLLRGER